MIVDLTEQEWLQVVLPCMAYAPANQCVQVMNKIGAQVQKQQADHNPSAIKRNSSNDMPATIPTNLPDDMPLKRNN